MIEQDRTIEVLQSVIAGWEVMLSDQIKETEKWHGMYMDLLKEQIERQHKAMEEFAR
jgi:hypothetical protein